EDLACGIDKGHGCQIDPDRLRLLGRQNRMPVVLQLLHPLPDQLSLQYKRHRRRLTASGDFQHRACPPLALTVLAAVEEGCSSLSTLRVPPYMYSRSAAASQRNAR